jgi:hypothetical protein
MYELVFIKSPNTAVVVTLPLAVYEACDGHTVHKVIQGRLTADSLARRERDCPRMRSKFSSDWLPSYIKAT